MKDSSLLEIPTLPDAFGNGMGADTATRALTENETRDDDATDDAPDSREQGDTGSPDGLGDETAQPAPRKSSRAQKSRPASVVNGEPADAGAPAVTEPEKVSKRAVKRLRRDVLEDRYLTSHDELATLRARNVELERKTAVVQAVGSDVVDEGVQNTVRELIELADSVTQMLVKPNVAAVVKLTEPERARLVKLGAPLVRLQLSSHIAASPWLAFTVCALSIAIGKFVAYKLATADAPSIA